MKKNMKTSILFMVVALMTAIFITLIILPVNLSSATTLKKGKIFYVGNTPACDCITEKQRSARCVGMMESLKKC